ncbi:MAG: PDZ domain-containing protein [Xanthomonadales bacterium]|nr:PDZ domain-containing protein [Xanthomonadales bacterium]
MLVGLDPHSEYLEADELDQLNEDTSGSYAGLGLEVTTVDGFLRVIAPIDETPAERAGIKAGDTILRIDNVLVQADNLGDAVDMLRGVAGSDVTLSILREGSREPQDFKLKREIIPRRQRARPPASSRVMRICACPSSRPRPAATCASASPICRRKMASP